MSREEQTSCQWGGCTTGLVFVIRGAAQSAAQEVLPLCLVSFRRTNSLCNHKNVRWEGLCLAPSQVVSGVSVSLMEVMREPDSKSYLSQKGKTVLCGMLSVFQNAKGWKDFGTYKFGGKHLNHLCLLEERGLGKVQHCPNLPVNLPDGCYQSNLITGLVGQDALHLCSKVLGNHSNWEKVGVGKLGSQDTDVLFFF